MFLTTILNKIMKLSLFPKFYAIADDEKSPPATFTGGVAGAGPAVMGNNNFQNFVGRLKLPFATYSVSPQHKIAIIYGRETPVAQTNWLTLAIGSIYIQFPVASAAIADIVIWKKISATLWVPVGNGGLITDPGDAGAISVVKDGYCPIVTAGAETRTLAIPSYVGQRIAIGMSTDAGDAVITVASAIDSLGHTTITLNDAADYIILEAMYSNATTLAWRVVHNDGALLGGTNGFGNVIADPGDAGAIPVIHKDAFCALTSAGAETRTLAIPTMIGQKLRLWADTYVGDIVVTVAAACNVANNNTLTFGAASEFISLVGVSVGGSLVWQIEANDGVGLTTV